MAEYRLEFSADSLGAENSIKRLRAEISKVTDAFEKAKIGSDDFNRAASNLSGLNQGLKTARSAVVDLDRAYQNLSRSLASFRSGMGARGAIPSVASPIGGLVGIEGSPADIKAKAKAYEDAYAELLKAAEARDKAITAFRAGMGAKGAIPGIASPIEGGINIPGSPSYAELGSLNRLRKELQDLQAEASRVKPSSQEWAGFQQQIASIQTELRKADQAAEAIQLRENLGAFAPYSLDAMQTKLRLIRIEANNISPNTKEWKDLNKEIQALEKGIQKVNRKPLTMGQRAGAAGGAFLYGGGLGGGVGSALGGIAGGLMGGVPGAFTGAAVGQLVDNLGQYAAGIGKVVAETNKAKIALAGVSNNQKDYEMALNAATAAGEKYLLPLDQSARQFAKLQASVRGAGFDTSTTTKAFNAIASAIIATGGSTQDLNSALTATSQVFSKGKLSAEELRQQLGERLPGAFTIFAQSIGKTPQEVDKLLQEGKLGLEEFVVFLGELEKRYGTTAEILANAPENAGPRLQVALNALALSFGGFFQKTGAGFQSYTADLVNFVLDNQKSIKRVVTIFAIGFQTLDGLISKFTKFLVNSFNTAFTYLLGNLDTVMSRVEDAINRATAASSLSPERISRLQDIARRSTEKRYGLNVFGAQTGLILDQNAASKYYNNFFNQLVDNATKSTGRKKYTDKIKETLFPEFTPSSFGTGLGEPGQTPTVAGQKESSQKKTNLEAFERLRDQLANAYNQAEIERIKARYELEKRLRDDLYDRQEFGANRLQRQALGFLRALMKAEDDRVEAVMQARLDVMEKSGSVAGGAGGTGAIAGGASSSMSIVEFGKALQKMGFTVKEHPAFGGVGKHSRGSYHYSGEALDITDWRGGDWKGRTKGLGEILRKSGAATEVFHPGYDPVGGHKTHVHAAFKGGRVPLTAGMQQFLGGQIGAGVPRKVGSNESRDTMAGVNVELAKAKALETERGQEMLKNSAVMKEVARYAQEAYGLPDLELDNKRLTERNRLVAEGLDENTINYRMRLLDIEEQHSFLRKEMTKELKKLNLTEAQRKDILNVLTEEMNKTTAAEKKKNDETLRGLFIQKTLEQDRRLALAQAISPDEELRVRLQQENPYASTLQIEELFQKEKVIAQAEALKQQLNSIASSIGDAFGNAFKGMITGSMTVTEALSGMFKSIADSFADMAAKMIADWMRMQIIGLVKKIFSFLPGMGGKTGELNFADMAKYSGFANGGVAAGGFRAFANGGIVQGPTLGLVGEGRYNEAIVPLPDGRSIPVQMQGGSSRDLLASSGTQSSAPPVLSMNFQSTTINGVEYVDRAQLEAAMQETRKLASRDGASRGASLALDRLQNSPSTRRRVGIR